MEHLCSNELLCFSLKMNEFEIALNRALPSIARRLLNELVIIAPVDTGRLKNSLKVKATNDGLIIWMVDYGKYVEFGRNPRVITPVNKKALAFKKGGKTIIVKKVKQGAVRPNPFVRNTLQNKLRGIIVEELMKEIN